MAELIRVVTICGLGADLCTMPLVMCSFMLWLGLFPTDPQVYWVATPWALAASCAIVGAEIAIDLLASKDPLVAKLWSRTSHVLSMTVTVVTVHALGANLSVSERIAAISAGLVATGVVKEGIDQVKVAVATWRA